MEKQNQQIIEQKQKNKKVVVVPKNQGSDPEYIEKFQKRYDQERQNQLKQGAQLDASNGSLIRNSKKTDKLKATSREGNIALEVDRPILPTQKFEALKQGLLDQPEQDALNHIQLPAKQFLDTNENEANEQDTTIMVSFPRSGNTLLRAYLEKIMGLTSGSDCDITKKLNKDLMLMGLAGEGLVDKRVWVVKTHYPERYGKTKFYAERAILLVRNPMDCITSLYNMVATGSHNRSIHDDDYVKFPKVWTDFIQQDITVWKDFHNFWLNAKIPVHIVKYEDIVQSPYNTLKYLLEFIMNVQDIAGTKVEHFLKIAVNEASPQIYKPRVGKVLGNKDKFNKNQLEFMTHYTWQMLYQLNYLDSFKVDPAQYSEKDEPNIDLSVFDKPPSAFITEFNKKNLKETIRLQNECDNVTSIYINFPALLLRKKSELYPNGRTSHRFKNFLRKKVTIIDKNKDRIDQNEEFVNKQKETDDAEQELEANGQ